jgi:hypothetical protein
MDFLKALKKLKSLSILNFDYDVDVAYVKDLPALTRLSVLGNNILNFSTISEVPKLQWLSLCGDFTQSDFNFIVSKQPKLEVLELIEGDSIKNLKTLTQLTNLKALSITGKDFDWKSVLEVKGLSYLSLPSEALKDPEDAAMFKKAFPNCTIVPNDGFCMGSGWLILFLPLVFAISFFRIRYLARKSQ